MRFLWCTYLCSSVFGSWDQFFTYADHAFWSKNVVWPTQPHVKNVYLHAILSFLLTYECSLKVAGAGEVYSRFCSRSGPPFIHPTCSSLHLHTNSLPFSLPPRLSTPDDTLPMAGCIILPGESAPTHFPPYPRNYSVWKHTISNHSKGTHGALIHSLVDHTPLGIAPWPSFNAL